MKALLLPFSAVVVLICLGACAHGRKETAVAPTEPAAEPRGQVEKFTGEVVRAEGGYRFKLLNEPAKLFRLTKAKESKEFVAEEIIMRKYFSKTLVVRGAPEGEWIAGADILGQWLRPGEKRSATLTGPEPSASPQPR